MGWSGSRSLATFKSIAHKVFLRRNGFSEILSRLQETITSYWRDGRYSCTAIDDVFNTPTSCHAKMFNPLGNNAKVAVTTVDVKTSHPYLLTNYNGASTLDDVGTHKTRCLGDPTPS